MLLNLSEELFNNYDKMSFLEKNELFIKIEEIINDFYGCLKRQNIIYKPIIKKYLKKLDTIEKFYKILNIFQVFFQNAMYQLRHNRKSKIYKIFERENLLGYFNEFLNNSLQKYYRRGIYTIQLFEEDIKYEYCWENQYYTHVQSNSLFYAKVKANYIPKNSIFYEEKKKKQNTEIKNIDTRDYVGDFESVSSDISEKSENNNFILEDLYENYLYENYCDDKLSADTRDCNEDFKSIASNISEKSENEIMLYDVKTNIDIEEYSDFFLFLDNLCNEKQEIKFENEIVIFKDLYENYCHDKLSIEHKDICIESKQIPKDEPEIEDSKQILKKFIVNVSHWKNLYQNMFTKQELSILKINLFDNISKQQNSIIRKVSADISREKHRPKFYKDTLLRIYSDNDKIPNNNSYIFYKTTNNDKFTKNYKSTAYYEIFYGVIYYFNISNIFSCNNIRCDLIARMFKNFKYALIVYHIFLCRVINECDDETLKYIKKYLENSVYFFPYKYPEYMAISKNFMKKRKNYSYDFFLTEVLPENIEYSLFNQNNFPEQDISKNLPIIKNNISMVPCIKSRTSEITITSEEITRKIFQEIFNKPFIRSYPKFLINPVTGSQLELDGYCEELKLAFEYNGPCHYNKKSLSIVETKYKEYIKKKLCDDNGITLIIVPYIIDAHEVKNHIMNHIPKNLLS